VAVSVDGTNRVMTSPDGITWTARTATQANSWYSVTYGNGLFVAVSYDGTNRVMTSPDGITWTARTAAEANAWSSVTYGNGLFVAVSSDGTNRVMTSPDGVTWTARIAANPSEWESVTYGNGLFVAVASYANSGNLVMTSPDGITWTARTAAEANAWSSVTYGNGLFVAVCYDDEFENGYCGSVMTSPDGITWTARTAAAANLWYSVTYGNGLFVAVSLTGTNRVMTSGDGITWTARTAAEANYWRSVTYGNGLFVAVTYNGTNRVMTSADTTTFLTGDSAQIISGTLTGASQLRGVSFSGLGTKTFASNASTTDFIVATSTGTTTTPTHLTIAGNYTNLSTTTHPGFVTFAGTLPQTATGTMTGTSAFGTLALAGAGVKNFTTAASTTDLVVQTTASSTFSGPLTVAGDATVAAGAKIILAANATTSVSGSTTITGTAENPVLLRSTVGGEQFALALADEYAITYADVKDSRGSTPGGDIVLTDGTSIDSGNNTGWNFDPVLGTSTTISSAANQIFTFGQTGAISEVTITEGDTPTITSLNDLRITIATTSVAMRFDTTDTVATIAGTAAGKVSGTVSYENAGATLVLNVTEDLVAGETLSISDLSFTNFSAVSTATSALRLYTGGAADTVADAEDDKTIAVTGALSLGNHPEGQVDSAFSRLGWYNLGLFRFTLTPAGEDTLMSTATFLLEGVNGVEEADISNWKLYHDVNSDGAYDLGDILMDDAPVVSLVEQSGTAVFTLATTTVGAMDFLLIGDVLNINSGDQMDIFLEDSQVQATGETTSLVIDVDGEVSKIQHNQGGMGTRGVTNLGAVGGDAPAGAGEQGGGEDTGGSGEIDTNTSGDTLGELVNFYAPAGAGVPQGEWTGGANAYVSDGSYARATESGLRQSYSDFGFTIPGSNQIVGIEVKLEASATSSAGSVDVKLSWDGGLTLTPAQNSGTLTTSDTILTLGGPSDLWGRSWTPAEFTDENFGLELTALVASNTVQVDAAKVRVYHQASGGGGGGGGGEVRRPGLLPFASLNITEPTITVAQKAQLRQVLADFKQFLLGWQGP
jgi:hypothetical protein